MCLLVCLFVGLCVRLSMCVRMFHSGVEFHDYCDVLSCIAYAMAWVLHCNLIDMIEIIHSIDDSAKSLSYPFISRL